MKAYKKHNTRFMVITAIALVMIAVVVTVVFLLFYRPQQTLNDKTSKTTSKSETAQAGYSSGGNHQQSTSNNSSSTAIDKSGQNTSTTTDTPSSQWISSDSGMITVKQPVANSSIASGTTLRGTAQTNTVNYTLADNISGVISQGTLSVVNGVFSGIINFSTKGTSGQLSVFTFDKTTGAETNVINIPVRF